MTVGSGKSGLLPGLYMANLRGDVRLEWLRIARWDGETGVLKITRLRRAVFPPVLFRFSTRLLP